MKFEETSLPGAYVIRPDKQEDERGFFARTFCREEFKARGLNPVFVQCNISFNRNKGTLRGMHYQLPPHQETKLVSCVRGAVYDVIIDLRPSSPTYRRWLGIDLDEDNCVMLYIPVGFAHGFLTRRDRSGVSYLMGAIHHPGAAAGCRWNDPAFDIKWPLPVSVISGRDRAFPDFSG
ncbi:MAG: dTDP-4-dehydrorhamnose 3,5-epimerase [PVC group bacterium]